MKRLPLILALAGLAGCGSGGTPIVIALAPDFALLDVNPNSTSYNTDVSPRQRLGVISAWYFGTATWGYCRSQFGYLNQMQQELGLGAILLGGINLMGSESGNAEICAGRTICWLQDTLAEDVWTDWEVVHRDVIILDRDNVPVAVFNLTDHNLAIASEYAALKTILEGFATP